MSNFISLLVIIAYIPALIFGTHFIRTWAFNRHEAVTFETSSICAMLVLLFMWHYGVSAGMLLFFILLLIMFAANAFTQWHFYMVLQDIIKRAFSGRAEYLKKQGLETTVNDNLLTMASVAIMPSFSRFIEESKIFNNPGGFIGLIKSIMKRQRFQKKKYLMRECFAENVNLIGPCKPEIDSMMLDEKHVIPGAIHANDLALGYRDEKIGLFTYDILGFGAHIAVFCLLLYNYFHPMTSNLHSMPELVRLLIMLVTAVLFTLYTHILRHFGFARYESVCYEFGFSALVIASFRVFDLFIRQGSVPGYQYFMLLGYFAVFLFLSYSNKHLDKKLHKDINELFDRIIYNTKLETETDRTKRRFLSNLKIISEWTIVPYTASSRFSGFFKKLSSKKADAERSDSRKQDEEEKRSLLDRLREFEEINDKKVAMPGYTEELIDKIIPEHKDMASRSDFTLDEDILHRNRIINNIVSLAAFGSLFLFMGLGII